MKARKKAVLTAAAVTALFTMSGCGKNEVATVYGPPPDYIDNVEESFKPSRNENMVVYGPPSYFRRLAEKRVEKEKEGSDEKK